MTDTPRAAGRWTRIALVVSLALNLAVAGVVAGAMIRGGPMHRGEMGRDPGFGPFTEALSPEDRTALRRAFLQNAPEFRDGRRALRADFAQILAGLRAEPFDRDAMAALLARQQERMATRLQLGQRLILDRVAEMTPEARAAFADRLEQSLARAPRRGAPKP